MMKISEADWKVFKEMRLLALQRYAEESLQLIAELSAAEDLEPHDRYLAIYKLIQERDEQVAFMFDWLSRSRARMSLRAVVGNGLLKPEEIQKFSKEIQDMLEDRL